MADGTTHIATAYAAPRLAQATQARSSLWARCRCGHVAAIDPTHWIGQGLSRQPVENLEGRLRCVCGARRVRLEVRGLSEAPQGVTGGIYVFR
ncbi:hypothetical protein [Phenylobacterium sp.]|jgi:hypothetical protein|uniref:hypothetical protein n=1 Tax=Phenylobacterium sp. TaxID=1871053 RepID=UPI002F947189